MTRTSQYMHNTDGIVAEFSYRLCESTKCSISGISINEYKNQIDKLIKLNCSKMMNDDSCEALIYNRNLFNNRGWRKSC